jgi:hypothetical protein
VGQPGSAEGATADPGQPAGRLRQRPRGRELAGPLGAADCYKNWLLKDRLLRVQVQTVERNGMGVPLYTGAEREGSLAAGLKMARAWRGGDDAGAAVPFGAT